MICTAISTTAIDAGSKSRPAPAYCSGNLSTEHCKLLLATCISMAVLIKVAWFVAFVRMMFARLRLRNTLVTVTLRIEVSRHVALMVVMRSWFLNGLVGHFNLLWLG